MVLLPRMRMKGFKVEISCPKRRAKRNKEKERKKRVKRIWTRKL